MFQRGSEPDIAIAIAIANKDVVDDDKVRVLPLPATNGLL